MPRIAILTPSLTTGDAVGNDVLVMHDVLRRRGLDVRLYAEGWSNIDDHKIWPADKIGNYLKSKSDALIYHYSRGWDFGLELLSKLGCETSVRYHNVTPPEFFTRSKTALPGCAWKAANSCAQLRARAATSTSPLPPTTSAS